MYRHVFMKYLKANSFSPVTQIRSMTQSYYDVLGLKQDATQDEIKEAYINLSKKLHPDVNKHDTKTDEKFIQLNQAYKVLSLIDRRTQYDMELTRPQYMGQNYPANYGAYRVPNMDYSTNNHETSGKNFTKKTLKDAAYFAAALIVVGIGLNVALDRAAEKATKKTSHSELQRYLLEIEQKEEQSISELIAEVEEIQRVLAEEKR